MSFAFEEDLEGPNNLWGLKLSYITREWRIAGKCMVIRHRRISTGVRKSGEGIEREEERVRRQVEIRNAALDFLSFLFW